MHAQWGRKVVSVMQRLHGHVRLSFPRYMHINLRPPAVQDQLRSIYYRILDTFDRGAAFSRVGRTDTFVQSAKRWHSILQEVYGWTISHEELFAGFESLNRATRGDKSREIGNPFCPLDRVGCVKFSVVDGEIC